ncbi:MAG: hypothetical protein DSZ32_06975 [Gammaproteobacteria bacterium]|nr:MAG: hypothetical protein DSZ32_06975 [Gammaproteobacteria bacterium]
MRPDLGELDPITLLQEMERVVLTREKERSQSGDGETTGQWYGIGYMINGLRFVSPLKHVREVLLHSHVVAVPETLPWMRGLANSRGNLITVVDIAEFLEWPSSENTETGRWMLINDTRLNCAIAVQEVVGLKLFHENQTHARDSKEPRLKPVEAFLTGRVFTDDEDWHELDLMVLSKDKNFVNAAAHAG